MILDTVVVNAAQRVTEFSEESGSAIGYIYIPLSEQECKFLRIKGVEKGIGYYPALRLKILLDEEEEDGRE